MCVTNVYLREGDRETLLYEEVTEVLFREGTLYIRNARNDVLVFEGELQETSFLNHRIVVRKRSARKSLLQRLLGVESRTIGQDIRCG